MGVCFCFFLSRGQEQTSSIKTEDLSHAVFQITQTTTIPPLLSQLPGTRQQKARPNNSCTHKQDLSTLGFVFVCIVFLQMQMRVSQTWWECVYNEMRARGGKREKWIVSSRRVHVQRGPVTFT